MPYFFLGDSPASEFHVATFRNTLFRLRRSCEKAARPTEHTVQIVPKSRYIKVRRRGMTNEEECNIHNTATV